MLLRERKLTLFLILFSLVFAACSAPAPIPLLDPTAVFVTRVARIPTPVIVKTLSGSVVALCDQVYSKPSAGMPEPPVLSVFKKDYEPMNWSIGTPPPIYGTWLESDARTIACLMQTRNWVGNYTDGAPAYRNDNVVKLVRVSDGQVIAAKTFMGRNPPFSKTWGGPGESGVSDKEYLTWLYKLLGDDSILVHGSTVYNLAFSPDGATFASAAWSGFDNVRLWESSGNFLKTLPNSPDMISSLVFSPDQKRLAAGGQDGRVVIWDMETWQVRLDLKGESRERITGLAYSSNGNILASGACTAMDKNGSTCNKSEIRLLDPLTGKTILTSGSIDNWVIGLALSPDGKKLAWGNWNGIVKVWDWTAKSESWQSTSVRSFAGHQDAVVQVKFSPDGLVLASASEDGTVGLWDLLSAKLIRRLAGHTNSVRRIAFHPNGRVFASGSSDHTIRLWNAANGQTLRTLVGHSNGVTALVFSPDGKTLASAEGDLNGTIKLWKIEESW